MLLQFCSFLNQLGVSNSILQFLAHLDSNDYQHSRISETILNKQNIYIHVQTTIVSHLIEFPVFMVGPVFTGWRRIRTTLSASFPRWLTVER